MKHISLSATVFALAATAPCLAAQSTAIFDRVGNDNHIVWYGANHRPYQVEVSPDLVNWAEVGPVYTGVDDLLGNTDINNAPSLFYRVREGAMRPGFDDVEFGRNDDFTYPDCDEVRADPQKVPFGFSVHFFGTTFTECYVNNNGNITFDETLDKFTPFDLGALKRVMIAPFWADVDTRLSNEGPPHSGLTRFSATPGSANGRPAFGVTWRGVGYFGYGGAHVDKRNDFQMLLIDRSDLQTGDFDIEFNYNQIQWETGDASGGSSGLGGDPARVGWANGSGRFMQYKGSDESLAFLDHKPGETGPNFADGLKYQMWNSDVPGRIVIPVRNGIPGGAPGYDFVVNAGSDQYPYNSPNTFYLSGSITPPDTTGVIFKWTQMNASDGHQAVIADPGSLTTSVTIPEPGDYTFMLTATKKGTFFSLSSDEVLVKNMDKIEVEAGPDYEMSLSSLTSYPLANAVAKYNSVNITNVVWDQIEGAAATISDTHVIRPLITPPGPGTYKFRLTANCGDPAQWVKTSEATLVVTE